MLFASAHRTSDRSPSEPRRLPLTHQDSDFSILMVCRANLCRSPMAEFLCQRQVDLRQLPIRVSSAGTHAKPDRPMHAFARQALAAERIEPDSFLSRPVTQDIVEPSSLILTMTDAQRSWVVNAFPQAVRRTYLLSQFCALVEATPDPGQIAPREWGASLLARATEGRGLAQPLFDGRDIEDPIGRPPRQFQACARLIEQRLVPLFAGVPAGSGK